TGYGTILGHLDDGTNDRGILGVMSGNGVDDLVSTRFIVKTNGNVGIGTTSPGYPLQVMCGASNYAINATNSAAAGTIYGISMGFSGQAPNDTTSKWINCHDGTHRFVVYSDGDVYTATGTDIQQYSSDQRMKENIDDYTGGLSIVNDLRPVTYTWKEGKDMGNPGTHYGFIAQEIEAISEVTGGMNLFSVRELEEDSDDRDLCTDGLMHTTQLSAKEAIFISAIQELSAEVNTLQAQISGSSNFSTLKTAVTGT
ncbi:MAG: tail fiber domain-containing protein, partial [Anaerolineales bacterium]|nr:tail fiber domain-containing protein [Anaerolineales bacterium]